MTKKQKLLKNKAQTEFNKQHPLKTIISFSFFCSLYFSNSSFFKTFQTF